MFRSTKNRMQALLDVVDDMLAGADGDDEVVKTVAEGLREPAHPHRRAARVRIERRVGSVAARETVCLSPVGSPPPTRADRVGGSLAPSRPATSSR